MTSHAILVAAKGYLLTHGWAKEYGSDGAPRCVLGALRSVAPNVGVASLAGSKVMLAAGIRSSLAQWNDEEGRTLDEVIAALDAAILQTAPKDTPAPQPETASPSVTHVFA